MASSYQAFTAAGQRIRKPKLKKYPKQPKKSSAPSLHIAWANRCTAIDAENKARLDEWAEAIRAVARIVEKKHAPSRSRKPATKRRRTKKRAAKKRGKRRTAKRRTLRSHYRDFTGL